MDEGVFEFSLKRMSRIWMGRNERAPSSQGKVPEAQRQGNERPISGTPINLVQKGNAISGGTGGVFSSKTKTL